MPFLTAPPQPLDYGHTVVRAAFVLALFGWGFGFYGPPIFLHAVLERTGWPLALVSGAVSFHFLLGAAVIAYLPSIHRRLGVPASTLLGAALLATGVLGWAMAATPWQLFLAALLTGAGWVPLGAAGIHAMVAPWFGRQRPMALAKAYNGASIGGVVFAPLWVLLMELMGFAATAVVLGIAMLAVVTFMATRVLSHAPCSPADQGLSALAADTAHKTTGPLWRDRRFLTLAAAMALGLFAQIGLIAQLFSLMVPTMGPRMAAAIMALATGCGMGGRLLMGRLLAHYPDRRLAAAASYGLQAGGTLLLWMAGADHLALWVLGMVFFGLGIGNATSLPPLIAQADFAPADVPRVVARTVALSQALYAFAPALLAGLMVTATHPEPVLGVSTAAYFAAIFLIQLLAAACVISARRPALRPDVRHGA